MLATPGPLPDGPEWLYEVKWDGMRVLPEVTEGTLRLTSRSGQDVTGAFPEFAPLAEVVVDGMFDGEVVLLAGGIPSLAALADRMHLTAGRAARLARRAPAVLILFDVLRLYGVDLSARPLMERRATLERLDLAATPQVLLSPAYSDGAALLAATVERGMEGVVAKRRDGVYRSGVRAPSWVKVTLHRTQSCVVGGWRPERGGSRRLGALLLGVPGRDGGLRFAGRVGAGLGERAEAALRAELARLEAVDPPFSGPPLPRADAAGAVWCKPRVVVDVTHLGWTAAGRLRQPVLRGPRLDLDPGDVRREG